MADYNPDEEALRRYLIDKVGIHTDTLQIKKFSGGYSNLTYLLTINDKKKLVLRRPPVGANVKSGHDMGREFRILSTLHPAGLQVPAPIHYCNAPGVIGDDFYIMEYVQGTILRAGLPEKLIPDAETMAGVFGTFTDQFVQLHGFDYAGAGLSGLGNPDNYPQRQIEGWTRRYESARTGEVRSVEKLILWLNDHIPAPAGASLIHNDFKYDNLVFDTKTWQVRAILDWEMSTIGDPLMDLGSSLGYWVTQNDPDWLRAVMPGPTLWDGNPGREGFMHHYALASGRDPGDGVVYFAYGLLKLAVIAQQIYARWQAGVTADPKFAGLGKVVQGCGTMALQAIDRKRIDNLF